MDAADNPDDIHAQVLQTTLAEIATSRHEAAESSPADASEPHDCCVICLDSISEPCAALPCGHANFDFLCLVSWLQEQPNCPLCKANVYKVRYADAQEGEAFYRVPNAPRTRDAAVRDEHRHERYGRTDLDSPSRRRFTPQNGRLRETDRRCPSPDEAIRRRRHIYQHQLYSLHVGSNRISQYRPPPTATQFSSTPHLVSRARLWLRRELQVFSFLSDADPDADLDTPTNGSITNDRLRRRRNNAEFLLEYTIAILKTVDLQGSAGQAEAMLSDFLGGEHARLFLHELRSWLRSPAPSLAAWDREVQYPDVSTSSSRGRKRRRSRSRSMSDSLSLSRVSSPGLDRDPGLDGEGGHRRRGDGNERIGRSWRDWSGGDHWRAGNTHKGGRRKRKVGEGDEHAALREGRMGRQERVG